MFKALDKVIFQRKKKYRQFYSFSMKAFVANLVETLLMSTHNASLHVNLHCGYPLVSTRSTTSGAIMFFLE